MTTEVLITCLEQTMTYPIRSFADGMEIRDWGSWQTKMDPSFGSADRDLLSMIRISESKVPEMLDLVCRYYGGHGKKSFGIIVAPYTQPEGLADLLLERGARRSERYLGMVLPVTRELAIEVDSRIEVREVDLEGTTGEMTEMIDRAWSMPGGSTRKGVDELRKYDPAEIHAPRIFMAFYDGKPAAFSAMDVYDDLPVIRIAGGATDPAYRGKGLYKAMIKARLESARNLGKDYLAVQAKVDTSAPILERLGFETLCEIEKYDMDVPLDCQT